MFRSSLPVSSNTSAYTPQSENTDMTNIMIDKH